MIAAYGLALSMSANLAYNLASQSAIDGGGGSAPSNAITTDDGTPIVTDSGEYIVTG